MRSASLRSIPGGPVWPRRPRPRRSPQVDPATADATPDARAALVRAFVDAAGGLEAAGYCRTSQWTGAFVNSVGQELTGESAEASMDGIARRAGVDGVARLASNRLADLDGAVLGARAAAKVQAGADPIELPPGRYEVVLEPDAVADVLQNLAVWCFSGKAVNERRSFAELGVGAVRPGSHPRRRPARRRGQLRRRGHAAPAAGARRRRDDGCRVPRPPHRGTRRERPRRATPPGWRRGARSRSTCSCSADAREPARADALAEVDGPVADSAVAALVAGVARGVLVTDFWYTRVLDPKSLAITGLTRNGVWLIEDGEVTQPLRNFRFTQSYGQALEPGAVLGVGAAAVDLPDSWVSARWTAPALHLASWNFTGGASG